MAGNRGQTSLRRKRRNEDPMREYDRLPSHLRSWLAQAARPWRARSVRQTYEKALARTDCAAQALAELDALEARLLAKDAKAVWGTDHPAATAPSRILTDAPTKVPTA